MVHYAGGGDYEKSVALFHQKKIDDASMGRLVPYVLPHTCNHIKTDFCDQADDDFVLYEFSFVAIDKTGNRSPEPAVCNVVVHDKNIDTDTITKDKVDASVIRYDFLLTTSYPLDAELTTDEEQVSTEDSFFKE